MGLFHKQSKPADDSVDIDQEQLFLDENFREELRNHGRWYFEKVINENGVLFKKDLDSTIEQIDLEITTHITQKLDTALLALSTELKDHVSKQIEEQFASYTRTMKEAQETALSTMTHNAQDLQVQHKQLSETLAHNVSSQEALLHTAFEENKAQIVAMKDAQNTALQWLNYTAQELQTQQKQIAENVQKNATAQEKALVDGFQSNMAQIVEHYLLGALGDQYDLKAQLPSIVKQLEANRQTIVDDIHA